jgi:hypothetical protein
VASVNLDGIEILDAPEPRRKKATSRPTTGSSNENYDESESRESSRESPPVRISAPRPRKRAPASKPSGVTASQRESLKGLFAVTLGGADWAANAFLPKYWTADDRLKDYEGKLLVDGIWAEVSMHPKLLEILLNVSNKSSGHAQFAGALILVSLPRLANHGAVPAEFAKMASYFALNLATLGANSVPVEPRTTPDSSSGNGTGEINSNGVVESPEEIQDSTTVQTRRSRVATRTDHRASVPTQNGTVR